MSARFSHHLQVLSEGDNKACLLHIQHGIEKEGLRVTADLHLSPLPHPEALGSSLTHPYITTDYAEPLLEFITPVYRNPDDALDFLRDLHTQAMEKLPDGELIWAASMPAILQGDDNIPVATFGTSNIGQARYVYRQGLAHRYGKTMQTIAGIHYNFSLPEQFWEIVRHGDQSELSAQDYQSASYFALIRNFRRYAWLLNYLFGASPAVDASFVQGNDGHGLEPLDQHTWYLPWATSLRMGDLGYTSAAQACLPICYNTLDEYVDSLWQATHTTYPPYQEIGIKGPDGEYRQLNTNLLQIENEYYSIIRPKPLILPGKKPLVALRERGVEYIEVRCLDINPLLPLGIDGPQARFVDTFLLFCALQNSPVLSDRECTRINANFNLSVKEGRHPDLQLLDGRKKRRLTEWGADLIEQMVPLAALLDSAHNTGQYSESLNLQHNKLRDPSLTPSAMILKALQSGHSFREFAARQSRQHMVSLTAQPRSQERQTYFDDLAERSLQQQAEQETLDSLDFETFVHQYFSNEKPDS